AQRIRPAMDDSELAAVVRDHYAAEAQTLTTGAEANLLKLAELRGTLTEAQAARWAEVKSAYARGAGAPEAGRTACAPPRERGRRGRPGGSGGRSGRLLRPLPAGPRPSGSPAEGAQPGASPVGAVARCRPSGLSAQ